MRELDHRLSATELMLLNCSPREDSWESLGQQRRSNQSILKEINPEYSFEGLIWSWSSNNLATWLWRAYSLEKTLMLGKKLKAKGERGDRGWDGYMASLTQWTWVWVNSGSWWWTGRPGVLWFMRLQRVGHDWVIELNWTDEDLQDLLKPTPRKDVFFIIGD